MASIWPQPYSRGEHVEQTAWLIIRFSASIWPQPYSRGEPWCAYLRYWFRFASNLATALQPWRTPSRPRSPPPSRGFQFGHSLTAVENGPKTLPSLSMTSTLQFGHSLTAVENSAGAGATTVCRLCFNLATALQPWRTSSDPDVRKAGRLQFGHSLTAVENHSAGDPPQLDGLLASIWPTALQPWRTWRCSLALLRVRLASIWPQPYSRENRR